jgi:hypothetical protein
LTGTAAASDAKVMLVVVIMAWHWELNHGMPDKILLKTGAGGGC